MRLNQNNLILFCSLSGCTSLVLNNNVKFSASSSVLGPGKPVVGGNDVWCAGIPTRNQWLKVDLGNTQISKIVFYR